MTTMTSKSRDRHRDAFKHNADSSHDINYWDETRCGHLEGATFVASSPGRLLQGSTFSLLETFPPWRSAHMRVLNQWRSDSAPHHMSLPSRNHGWHAELAVISYGSREQRGAMLD
jgi:hypothetical protein